MKLPTLDGKDPLGRIAGAEKLRGTKNHRLGETLPRFHLPVVYWFHFFWYQGSRPTNISWQDFTEVLVCCFSDIGRGMVFTSVSHLFNRKETWMITSKNSSIDCSSCKIYSALGYGLLHGRITFLLCNLIRPHNLKALVTTMEIACDMISMQPWLIRWHQMDILIKILTTTSTTQKEALWLEPGSQITQQSRRSQTI